MKYQKTALQGSNKQLDRYLKEIGKQKLLSADEEVRLMKRIKHGDKKAFEKMITCNLRFVVSIARQFQYQGLSLDDLIDEGNYGLIKAINKFDETKGFKFISYAVWWIRQAIMQAIQEQTRIVRLPANRVQNIIKLYKATSKLEKELERVPNAEELAEKMNISQVEITEVWEHSARSASLDGSANPSEDSFSLLNILPDSGTRSPDNQLESDSLKKHIKMLLKVLTEKEAAIIQFYYGIDKERAYNLEELGEMFNLTRERIRQIKERAVHKLKHASSCKRLKMYLE